MNFHVLTLFPEMIEQGVNTSITGRAVSKGLIQLNTINIRDFAGTGMGRWMIILTVEAPVWLCSRDRCTEVISPW